MKRPGPAPLPTNLKVLRGNPGKRRLIDQEPDPPVSIPSCPQHLGTVAKKEWRRITKELKAIGIITELDRAALAGYCDAYATWVEACGQLGQYGMVLKAPSGYPIPSPYLAIRDRSLDQMRAFLTEFGMTPSSRSRVRVKNPKQQNLFDFLDGEEETG